MTCHSFDVIHSAYVGVFVCAYVLCLLQAAETKAEGYRQNMTQLFKELEFMQDKGKHSAQQLQLQEERLEAKERVCESLRLQLDELRGTVLTQQEVLVEAERREGEHQHTRTAMERMVGEAEMRYKQLQLRVLDIERRAGSRCAQQEMDIDKLRRDLQRSEQAASMAEEALQQKSEELDSLHVFVTELLRSSTTPAKHRRHLQRLRGAEQHDLHQDLDQDLDQDLGRLVDEVDYPQASQSEQDQSPPRRLQPQPLPLEVQHGAALREIGVDDNGNKENVEHQLVIIASEGGPSTAVAHSTDAVGSSIQGEQTVDVSEWHEEIVEASLELYEVLVVLFRNLAALSQPSYSSTSPAPSPDRTAALGLGSISFDASDAASVGSSGSPGRHHRGGARLVSDAVNVLVSRIGKKHHQLHMLLHRAPWNNSSSSSQLQSQQQPVLLAAHEDFMNPDAAAYFSLLFDSFLEEQQQKRVSLQRPHPQPQLQQPSMEKQNESAVLLLQRFRRVHRGREAALRAVVRMVLGAMRRYKERWLQLLRVSVSVGEARGGRREAQQPRSAGADEEVHEEVHGGDRRAAGVGRGAATAAAAHSYDWERAMDGAAHPYDGERAMDGAAHPYAGERAMDGAAHSYARSTAASRLRSAAVPTPNTSTGIGTVQASRNGGQSSTAAPASAFTHASASASEATNTTSPRFSVLPEELSSSSSSSSSSHSPSQRPGSQTGARPKHVVRVRSPSRPLTGPDHTTAGARSPAGAPPGSVLEGSLLLPDWPAAALPQVLSEKQQQQSAPRRAVTAMSSRRPTEQSILQQLHAQQSAEASDFDRSSNSASPSPTASPARSRPRTSTTAVSSSYSSSFEDLMASADAVAASSAAVAQAAQAARAHHAALALANEHSPPRNHGSSDLDRRSPGRSSSSAEELLTPPRRTPPGRNSSGSGCTSGGGSCGSSPAGQRQQQLSSSTSTFASTLTHTMQHQLHQQQQQLSSGREGSYHAFQHYHVAARKTHHEDHEQLQASQSPTSVKRPGRRSGHDGLARDSTGDALAQASAITAAIDGMHLSFHPPAPPTAVYSQQQHQQQHKGQQLQDESFESETTPTFNISMEDEDSSDSLLGLLGEYTSGTGGARGSRDVDALNDSYDQSPFRHLRGGGGERDC